MPVVGQFANENRRNGRRPVGRLAEVILRQVWTIHLRRSGFDDLETTGDPWGPLSNRGHLHDIPTGHRRVPKSTWGPLDRCDDLTPEQANDIADHYRRMEHLSERFEDGVDRQIGVALSDGVHLRRIKADLRVGQHRIERVAKQLRIWMREPEETDGEG